MKDIAIYGFGGFGREIACLIKDMNSIKPEYNLIGFFDDGHQIGEKNRYGAVLGGINELNGWNSELAVVLAISTPASLKNISKSIINDNVWFPNIIAPNTKIFDEEAFKIGHGNIFFLGCRLSCDVEIGNFNLANGAVSLGHDVKVGNYNTFGPSTRISGSCTIGNENFFGVNATVLQGLHIGDNTRIGAGAFIMRNTKDNNLYIGNPAKIIKI